VAPTSIPQLDLDVTAFLLTSLLLAAGTKSSLSEKVYKSFAIGEYRVNIPGIAMASSVFAAVEE
jgi:hypothetical protein